MKFYTIKEVADIISLSEYTVRRFAREGKINAYKVGRSWRIKEEDLTKFIEKEQQ